MSHYATACICTKGHVIASKDNDPVTQRCSRCGSEVLSKCPNCKHPILGRYYDDDSVFFKSYTLPYYCPYCGEPYPWTSDIISKAIGVLALDEELDEETKSLLRDSFMDLVVETPGSTALAVARYKKFLPTASKFVQDGIRQLIMDVALDSIKKLFIG